MHLRRHIISGAGVGRGNSARWVTLGLAIATLSLLPETCQGGALKHAQHAPLSASRLLHRTGHWLRVARPWITKLTVGSFFSYVSHP
jgi:hypothetical protein